MYKYILHVIYNDDIAVVIIKNGTRHSKAHHNTHTWETEAG